MTYMQFAGSKQEAFSTLVNMIPQNGRVEGGQSANKALEKLRQVSVAYFNPRERGAAFKLFFGMSPGKIFNKDGSINFELVAEQVDPILDTYIEAAVEEQGLNREQPATIVQAALAAIRKREVALETAEKVVEALLKQYKLIPA